MTTQEWTLPDGTTLEVRREGQLIHGGWMEEPDPDWTFTDANGHGHWRDPAGGLPTLVWIETEPAYIDSEGEEYNAEGEHRCRSCGEVIQPGTRPPRDMWVTTSEYYLINGEPVSREQALALIERMKGEG